MWIGIDDTDSRREMCSTYIGFLMSGRFSEYMNSFPRLVRLNPNLPFKTRGNGAVSIEFCSHAAENTEPLRIGKLDGKDLAISGERCSTSRQDDIFNVGIEYVKKYGVKNEVNTNPGMVMSVTQFEEEIYKEALSGEMKIGDVRKRIEGPGSRIYTEGNGRGIIGSSAAIAWRKRKVTYELISYKYPHPDLIDDDVKRRVGDIAESFGTTFNNIDRENGAVSLFPRERTPVIYGIRGTDPVDLLKIQSIIESEYPEFGMNYIIFETNQGTDDHIEFMPARMLEAGSYMIQCTVSSVPRREKGGHLKFHGIYRGEDITLIAFEPSKKFRTRIEVLRPGDFIDVYGSYGKGSLKIEKIDVRAQARLFQRVVPDCPVCGERTKNCGNLLYKCPECGHMVPPSYEEVKREPILGRYEPPVSARRHLSMPWKLEGKL